MLFRSSISFFCLYVYRFVESMTHVLQTYLPKMSSPDLLRAVVSLCMLGHFPPAPLQQLLQGQTLDELRAAGQLMSSDTPQTPLSSNSSLFNRFDLFLG